MHRPLDSQTYQDGLQSKAIYSPILQGADTGSRTAQPMQIPALLRNNWPLGTPHLSWRAWAWSLFHLRAGFLRVRIVCGARNSHANLVIFVPSPITVADAQIDATFDIPPPRPWRRLYVYPRSQWTAAE